jgi:periplasmic protein TonB
MTEMGRTPPLVEPPGVAQPAQQEKRTLKVSEGVLEAQLITRIEPQFPSLAIQTKTQGTVRLHAIISRDGRITSLDVLSGHPFLVKAALDAVRQWRYRPTLLNGEPVEVETSITVIFRLQE